MKKIRIEIGGKYRMKMKRKKKGWRKRNREMKTTITKENVKMWSEMKEGVKLSKKIEKKYSVEENWRKSKFEEINIMSAAEIENHRRKDKRKWRRIIYGESVINGSSEMKEENMALEKYWRENERRLEERRKLWTIWRKCRRKLMAASSSVTKINIGVKQGGVSNGMAKGGALASGGNRSKPRCWRR